MKRGGRELLTTRIMINGHPGNEQVGVGFSVDDLLDRELILADFKPLPGSRIGELTARFDIILGRTPDETPDRSRGRQHG